jgi:integrase
MNVRPYKPGRWRLTWELGVDPATGRRRRETRVVTGTRREAERMWRERQAELDQGLGKDPTRRTVHTLLDAWLAHQQTRVRPSTWATYRHACDRFLRPTLGDRELRTLTPADIQAAVDAWARMPRAGTSGPSPSPVSPRTVRYALAMLRAALRQAVQWRWIPLDPSAGVVVPTSAPRRPQWWDVETVRYFLRETQQDQYWGAWALTLLTGLRQGELLGLRWADIDRAQALLHVRQVRGHGARAEFGPPKTVRSARTIALDPVALAVLDRIAAQQAAHRHQCGPDWVETGLVITTAVGTSVSPRNLLRAFHAAQARTGVPRIRWHDLRHTHATLLRQAGADWRVIADRLGHTQVHFTAQVYMHADVRAQRAVVQPLAQNIVPELKSS